MILAGLVDRARNTLDQRILPTLRPPCICEHSSRDPEKPGHRLCRHVIQTSPGNLEGARERICGGIPVSPRQEVCRYTIKMLSINTFESLSPVDLGHIESLPIGLIG